MRITFRPRPYPPFLLFPRRYRCIMAGGKKKGTPSVKVRLLLSSPRRYRARFRNPRSPPLNSPFLWHPTQEEAVAGPPEGATEEEKKKLAEEWKVRTAAFASERARAKRQPKGGGKLRSLANSTESLPKRSARSAPPLPAGF